MKLPLGNVEGEPLKENGSTQKTSNHPTPQPRRNRDYPVVNNVLGG